MKRLGVIVLSVILVLSVIACKGEKAADNKSALLELGLEVTEAMREMVYSDEYISVFIDDEYADEIGQLRVDDYGSPIAVYSVEMTSLKDILKII